MLAAKERLVSAGLATFDEMDTTCCYARQDKIWVHDPDGTPWEVFATHADVGEAADCCQRSQSASSSSAPGST